MAKSGSKAARRAAKKPTRVSAPPSGSGGIPKGFRPRKFIRAAEAHELVARTSAFMAAPPHICVPTGPPPAPCLRYSRDPNTGDYNIPPFGEEMDCAACRGS
jgi:hypothetical protein